jgi:hypothetical protein
MKLFFGSLFFCLFLDSNASEKVELKVIIADGAKTYNVYQSSEMSSLMKGVYACNMQLKADIEAGNGLTIEFPETFLESHSIELSDTKVHSYNFKHFSTKFIEVQRDIFSQDTLISADDRYLKSKNY